jgi:hypothetical protein
MPPALGRPFVSPVQKVGIIPGTTSASLFSAELAKHSAHDLHHFEMDVEFWHDGLGEDIYLRVDGETVALAESNWKVTTATTAEAPLQLRLPPVALYAEVAALPDPPDPIPATFLFYRIVCRVR